MLNRKAIVRPNKLPRDGDGEPSGGKQQCVLPDDVVVVRCHFYRSVCIVCVTMLNKDRQVANR